MRKFGIGMVALAAGATVAACGKKSSGGETSAQVIASLSPEARNVFTTRCATCHGQGGAGNGPAGAALTPPPRNFHDQAWQRTVTDDQLRRVIVEGGAAVGRSPTMPANPDLQSQPQVVAELVSAIRRLGQIQ